MTSQPGKQAIAIHILPNVSRSKGDQIKKFGQLIECNMKNWGFCNPDFMNKIEFNDLIWVRQLAIMDKGHDFDNFTKIGWANEREDNWKKTPVYVDWNALF